MTQHTANLTAHRKRPPLSSLGVALRYVTAVPFLAAGAALLTIGALIAGTSPPSRKSVARPQRDPHCSVEPKI